MKLVEEILNQLKDKGFKSTKVRKALVEVLVVHKQPIAVPEVLEILDRLKISANKTTIYRELTFLKEQGIVKEVDFGESKKRYEMEEHAHHHHLVCINCKKIEEFNLEQDLDLTENKIHQDKDFKVINHNLEFFGLCHNCH